MGKYYAVIGVRLLQYVSTLVGSHSSEENSSPLVDPSHNTVCMYVLPLPSPPLPSPFSSLSLQSTATQPPCLAPQIYPSPLRSRLT
jgi:hypothetical protein